MSLETHRILGNRNGNMKKKIITAIVLLILGICAIAAGIFWKPFARNVDFSSFTDETIGKTVQICVNDTEYMPIDDQKGIYLVPSEEGIIVPIAFSAELGHKNDMSSLQYYSLTLTGTVQKATAEMKEETAVHVIEYMEWIGEISGAYEITDEDRELIRSSVTDYCIEVTEIDIKTTKLVKSIFYVLGALLILSSIIVWISLISKKSVLKISLVFAGIAAVLAVLAVILFHKQIGIMANIRKDDEGVYFMEYDKELKLDEMLDAGITSDEELLKWLNGAEYHHLNPITIDTGRYGCSSFAAKTPDGEVLFGRNFDYPETDTVMIYMDPEDGYASYAMADLAVICVGRGNGQIGPDTPLGRFIMTATPYLVCDGINEAGLGVSTLELAIGEIHQNTGKPDLFIYTALRVILDRCATVDEAIDFLNSYDIHSHNDVRQHLFIVDKTGRSVVIEWFDDKMYVNELNAVTNSVLTPGDHYGEEADWRLEVLTDGLSEKGNILTPEQARDLLAAVVQSSITEWSAVYNLNDFTVDLYTDEYFDYAYRYGY